MTGEFLNFKTLMKLHNMEIAVGKIKKEIAVNERCLKEKMPDDLRRVIELQIEFEKKLLKLLDLPE